MTRFVWLDNRRPDNFSHLARLLTQYANEVGTEGDRPLTLQHLQVALERAVREAKAFQSAGPSSTEIKGVRNLVDFHSRQRTDFKLARQKELDDTVIKLRQWLSRQGAWFKGDAGLDKVRSRAVVYYDRDLRRQDLTRVRISGGLLYAQNGKWLDTKKMVTQFMGPGYGIYVMSAEGNLHIGSQSVGRYHHSSLLAGVPVAGAGEIQVRDGRILFLSNKSGHYQPTVENLLNVLGALQAAGYPLTFRVMYLEATASTGQAVRYHQFSTVAEFMKYIHLDDNTVISASRLIDDMPDYSATSQDLV